MMIKSSEIQLDEIDRIILREVQADGRISNTELARRIHLSPPATHARLRRLEEQGYIREYVALLNRERAGYDMLCFVSVSLQTHGPDQVTRFREAVSALPEVLECYHVTGEFDYLLKVVIRNRADLERFVVYRLTALPGVGRIHSSIVMSEIKTSTALPIPEE